MESAPLPEQPLPVVIAGAGPGGLVSALTLEKQGIEYVIYEKTTFDKLCSNAGSGIDMAPTAIDILDNELGLADKEWIKPYEYMHMSDMNGKKIVTYNLKKLCKSIQGRPFGFANRSTLQHVLLDALNLKDDDGNIKENDKRLHCSTSVTGYKHIEGKFARVQLSDGTTIDAACLLACDGIHSSIRKCMMNIRQEDDSLHYCGQEVWWGKTTIKEGSELAECIQSIISAEGDKVSNTNVCFMVYGTRRKPGVFFSCEVAKNEHAWLYVAGNKTPPINANATDDLTRRGGSVLTAEEKKQQIDNMVTNRNDIVRLIMGAAPDVGITHAAFYDRENLELPYVDSLVALLGDAAHCQSPMMGQGANMAIVDGYVAAMRISAAIKDAGKHGSSSIADNIAKALLDYDCMTKRKQNKKVIKKARTYGNLFASKNRMTIWMLKTFSKYAPSSMVVSEVISGDKSNAQFVKSMREDLQMDV